MHSLLRNGLNLSALVAVLMIIAASGCQSSPPKLTIENIHAEFSQAMRDESVVYLTIRNDGGKDTLMAAKIDIPGASADIHDMRGGMMILTNALPIPAKSTTELGPMGSHIMITGLPAKIKEDSSFTLTLVFRKSGEIRVPVRFTAPSPQPMMHEHHQ